MLHLFLSFKVHGVKMIARVLVIVIFSIVFLGCHSDTDPQRKELRENISKWQELERTDYQITTRVVCFCIRTDEIIITVEDEQIVEAFYAESGDFLEQSELSSLRTIEQHFDIIDEAISDNAFRLEVEYHPEFGFPTVISIDYAVNVADDEVVYYLSNLQ